MIPLALVIALIVALLCAGSYVALRLNCEEKKAKGGALYTREVSMSWLRKIEGDAESVIQKIEVEVQHVAGVAAEHVRAFESELVKRLKEAFGALEGKNLSVSVNSAGHFNDDGTGSATISITSAADAVPSVGTAPEAAPAPLEGAVGSAAEAPKEGQAA